MKSIEFIFVLICDDVRKEDNGKELLIGVYSGGIVVPSLPTFLPVVLWSQVKIKQTGEYKFVCRCVDDTGRELGRLGPGQLKVQRNGGPDNSDELSSIAFGQLPIGIMSPGRLHIEVQLDNEIEWERIKSVSVQVRSPA
jgi:hypothetical protein